MEDNNIQKLINLYNSGKLDVVEKEVIKQIKKTPNNFILYNLLGAVFSYKKELDKAVFNFRKSIQIKPDYAEGYNNLGSALYKLGKFNESIICYNKAIQIKINFAEAHNNLAVTFKELGKLSESIVGFKKAIEIKSNYAEAYNNLGAAYKELGKFTESIENHQKAIKIKSHYPEAHNNLALTFKELGKFKESINSFRKAIEIKADYAEAYNNLGNIFKILGKFNDSIDNYKKAIEIKPSFSEAYNNFGTVLMEINKVEESILYYKKAIKINASYAEAYNNLGNLFKDIGKIDDANKCFKKLIALKPENIGYKINSAGLIAPIVQSVEEINFYRDKYSKSLQSLKDCRFITEKPGYAIRMNIFNLAYHAKSNLEIMKKTSVFFRKTLPNINYVNKNINVKKNKKIIKIGFISQYLTNHTIGKLFGGLIKNIDKKKFETIIFHTIDTKKSLLRNEIDDSANKVINLDTRIQEQQQQIAKEDLDIIFYPDIGMSPTTYFLAFSRLAPVQIVSWGHPETTGVSTIDYFLSSRLFEINKKKNYSERLICLNEFPIYYEPPKNIGLLKNRLELKLPENVRLYGCPQSLFKLHPDFDAILSKILDRDKKGYIVLIGGEGKESYWIESLKKRWSKSYNVLNEKIIYTRGLSLLEYISLCNCVDVLLDPLHFGGGNTFLEAMLTGTPTITIVGEYLKSNITAAAYKQMKILNPPIASNLKEYVDLAVELAQDTKKNKLLRENSKIAAKKYLYNNSKTLKEFEKFLEESHEAAKKGQLLKDGLVIN